MTILKIPLIWFRCVKLDLLQRRRGREGILKKHLMDQRKTFNKVPWQGGVVVIEWFGGLSVIGSRLYVKAYFRWNLNKNDVLFSYLETRSVYCWLTAWLADRWSLLGWLDMCWHVEIFNIHTNCSSYFWSYFCQLIQYIYICSSYTPRDRFWRLYYNLSQYTMNCVIKTYCNMNITSKQLIMSNTW